MSTVFVHLGLPAGTDAQHPLAHGEPRREEAPRGRQDSSQEAVAEGEVEQQDDRREGEEGRRPRVLKDVISVSRKEREEHEATHTPFQPWRRHGVRARARDEPHCKKKEEDGMVKIPRVSFDCFFMSREDEKAHENPMIATVGQETSEKHARAIGHKGIGGGRDMDWLIKDMSDELKAWGHARGTRELILKCAGGSAIRAVREALAKHHGGRVPPEPNGVIEEARKTRREFVQVYKDRVEEKAGINLDSDEVIILWMIRWAAMVCSRYLVGEDRKTAYERREGRRCNDKVPAICQKVWYKKVRHDKERLDQLEVEREEGIWLGRARESNETKIGTESGVTRACAIRRMDPDEWDGEAIKRLAHRSNQTRRNQECGCWRE